MAAWRMAFRNGSRGENLWPKCRDAGLAVISYEGMDFDLSRHTPGETAVRWAQLESSQKNSLRTFAYRIDKGDIIYAKSGRSVVGKGQVKGGYEYDRRSLIRDSEGGRWPHTIAVRWDRGFQPVRIWVSGPQLPTIRPISAGDVGRLQRLEERMASKKRNVKDLEAREGQMLVRQARFRSRNRALIDALKAVSGCRCSICRFNFKEMYGRIGNEYIIAHHIEPLGSRKGQTRTTSRDIALICANCHAMIHVKSPPFRPEQLRANLKRRWPTH